MLGTILKRGDITNIQSLWNHITQVKMLIKDLLPRRNWGAGYQPQKVILFGSYAWGNARADSDIDLLVVKDTQERMVDRCAEVRRIVSDPNRFIGLKLLVLTPEEVSERTAIGDQFIAEIMERGQVLYAS